MIKSKLVCVVIGVVAVLLYTNIWVGSAAAGETKTLLIGDINPLTGKGAYWGTGAQTALDLNAEKVNKAGGFVIKGQRYNVKFIHEDDKYTGAAGVAAANKLIFTDKVKYIVGPLSSASVMAFQPIVESNKVVLICDTYAPPELLKGKKYTFRAITPPSHVAGPFHEWLIKRNPNLKRGAHITPNDATGWGSAQGDNDAMMALNIDVVANEYYERGTEDFTPMITRILSKKPDFLSMGGTAPGDAALIIKQIRELGFKGPIVHTGMLDPDDIGPIAGWENVEGVMSTAVSPLGDACPQSMKDFFADYKAKYGKLNSFAPHIYDMLSVLIMGMKKANSLDGDKIVEALENMGETKEEFQTIWGKAYFGGKDYYGNNHQVMKQVLIGQIQNRKLVTAGAVMPWEVPPPSKKKWR
jgi:branched-chain amino acid transport system substrate-binding protein